MKTNSISAGLAGHARTITTTRQLSCRRAWLWTGFLAFAMIAIGPPPAQAAVTEAWVRRYGSEAGSEDYASKVVTDAAGNVIVAGTTWHTQTGGGSDMLIIKHSGADVPLWTNRYIGSASAVAVDGSGNVFVTGSSTIKYSGAGVPQWTNRNTGPESAGDSANAVAVDDSGNVFVTGNSVGSGGNYPDYATIAYSGAGVPLWTNRYKGSGDDYDVAHAVAVDGSGNVFVTGSSGLGGVNHDYATIAYSGAGVPLWTNLYDGLGGLDLAYAVAVDSSGNVFVTGSSSPSGSYSDFVTIAYSGAGVPLWTNRYNGPANSNDGASAVAVDGSGNVFVTGSSVGSEGDSDFVTVKYVWRPEIAIQLLSAIPPKVNLTLSAAPNSSWAIERALEPTGPWTNLSVLLIGTNGSAQFQDTNSPSPAGFYRARQ